MQANWTLAAAGIAALAVPQACSNHRVDAAPALTPDEQVDSDASKMLEEGRQTFRHDTFGSERFYGDRLRLHESLTGVSPRFALQLGLKVDVDAVSPQTVAALRNGHFNLDDPLVTADLLRANAIVGVTGFFTGDVLTSVGIHCALCHSTVDDSLSPGIGRRLDGWPNRDLDIGLVLLLAPDLQPLAEVLQVPQSTVRTVLASWGAGKFDALLLLDGRAFRPDGKSGAVLLPPAFGLAGVNLHTSTGAWGGVTYWNAFVANIEMQGQGTFYDPRLADAAKYPIAAAAGFFDLRSPNDRITPKLAALHFYQLALQPPRPPEGTFDAEAAARGKILFDGQANCVRCHVPPLFTEPGWNLHTPDEIGIDDFQSSRSPDGRYRTAPLRGLFAREKGGFYHDGRFATLLDVVNHYDTFFTIGLSVLQKNDLVEYLRSL